MIAEYMNGGPAHEQASIQRQRNRDWIQEVGKRFKQSQIRAAVKVNDEMLRFYWSLGRDISRMSEEAKYGPGFYQSVSSDLKGLFPDIHSFSVTNLKYMRYFYELLSWRRCPRFS